MGPTVPGIEEFIGRNRQDDAQPVETGREDRGDTGLEAAHLLGRETQRAGESRAGNTEGFAPFADAPLTLHWHGDTFDLPQGAQLLAATNLVPHQAFSLGPNVIGFQFHPEAGAGNFEAWLIGHAAELAAAKIDVATLRQAARRHGAALAHKAQAVATRWLAGLTP